MYANFYGFREAPFSLLPDPDFLYLSAQHEQALNLLQLAATNHYGFCAISGAPGTGKSTLIRALLSGLDDNVCTGLITDTYSSFSELLKRILIAFELECDGKDDVSRYKTFTDFVIHKYAANQNVLLIVDEAQNLSHSVLEQLRMLSNINSDKDAMIQIMLVGQESLQDKLKSPHLKQLAQRIESNHRLSSLSEKDTSAYIRHRVSKAGGSAELFSDNACKLIHYKSDGIPRVINRICDLALVYGYAAEKQVISAEMVAAAAREQFTDEPSLPAKRGTLVPATPVSARPIVAKQPESRAITPKAQSVVADSAPTNTAAVASGHTTSDELVYKQNAMTDASEQKVAAIAQLEEAIKTAQETTQQSESLSIAAQRALTESANVEQKLSQSTEDFDHAVQHLESAQSRVKTLASEKTRAEQAATELDMAAATTRQRTRDNEASIAQQLEAMKLAEQQATATAKIAAMEAENAVQERIAAERAAVDVMSRAESAAKQSRTMLLEAESQAVEQTAELKAEAERADSEQQFANEAAQQKSAELEHAITTVGLAQDLTLKLATEKDEAATTAEQQMRITREINAQATQAETDALQAEEARQNAEQHAATQVTAEKLLASELADSLARIARQEADLAAASKAAALRMAREKEELARAAAEQATRAKADAEEAAGAEIRILMNEEEEDSAQPDSVISEISQKELSTVTRLASEARSRQGRTTNWPLIAASAASILIISWITIEANKTTSLQNVKAPVKTEAAALEIGQTDTRQQ